MDRRIDTALRRIRQGLSNLLDRSTVKRICRHVGHSRRVGVLCPYATLHWFLLQVLSGNAALEHIATLAKKAFTGSAYCQTRARLPPAVYQAILPTRTRLWYLGKSWSDSRSRRRLARSVRWASSRMVQANKHVPDELSRAKLLSHLQPNGKKGTFYFTITGVFLKHRE